MNLGTILGLAMFAAIPAPEPSPFCRDSGPPGARLLVVISDLHFGVGHDDVSGAVHPFEDFRWADDFTAFLADIDRRGRGKTTLVLNGDAFELWQSFAHDCRPPQKDWSCSESEALERLERVVTQHSREMTLLRTFAASSDNRLVLVPGNHDAALLFEKVAARALTAISAPEGRVCIARKGYWASPDGLVFAEHGHQIGDDVNAFSGWPEPFGGPAGERRLQKTWGEAFVEDYYNPYELKYPIIDNIAEVGVGLVYGLSAEGHLGSALALGKLVSFFVMKTSKEQFDQSLSPHAEARWDVTEARKQTDRLLIEAVPRASPLRGALEDLAARGELSAVELDDDVVRSLCDRRRVLSSLEEAGTSECPRERQKLRALAGGVRRSDHEIWSEHLDVAFQRLLRDRPELEKRFMIFVFSHTHRAQRPFEPLEESAVTVVNTGAWQRLIGEEELRGLREKCGGLSFRNLLEKLHLEDLPACYSAVVIEPYGSTPTAKLRFWTREKGALEMRESCEASVICP